MVLNISSEYDSGSDDEHREHFDPDMDHSLPRASVLQLPSANSVLNNDGCQTIESDRPMNPWMTAVSAMNRQVDMAVQHVGHDLRQDQDQLRLDHTTLVE